MKLAIEQFFNGTTAATPIATYDQNKISYGPHVGQFNLGSNPSDKFVGPTPIAVAYYGESALAIPSAFSHPIKISEDLWWIFGADLATAAATRRVQLWTWVPSTATTTLVGAVVLTYPTATVHTIRGMRAMLNKITTGTVAVSGTTVTGTGTAFDVGVCVGSRIGFGSTDSNQITTWYQIATTPSATSLTLTTSAPILAAGTPYVIEDLMLITTTTNATTTNGGLFVTKGLSFNAFQQPALTIPAATTVDKIRAVYWLKDAATQTNIVAAGSAIDDFVSLTEQWCYVVDGAATTLKIFAYNFRAPLTLTAGAATLTAPNLIITGNQTVTGNISQSNNGRIETLLTGPGANVKNLYVLTSTRLLRVPLTNITNGATTFFADSMSELPPGSANTNIAAGSFTSFDTSYTLDRVVIATPATSGSIYITPYNAAGVAFERRASAVTSQLLSANRDMNSPAFAHSNSGAFYNIWCEGGFMFLTSNTVTANLNNLLIYPMAADWSYTDTTLNRIICPKITLTNVQKLYRLVPSALSNLGSDQAGISPDAFRFKYRTSGISDNTGTWLTLPADGSLTGIAVTPEIQFCIEFRTLGMTMLPARVTSLALIYESASDLPSQYRWNVGDFNQATGTFAWIQGALFGSALTRHTIEIYRADTNALVLTQDSNSTTNGTFQFWNGSAWVAGLGPDTLNTRRRFSPSGSLPGSVDLYAKIKVD